MNQKKRSSYCFLAVLGGVVSLCIHALAGEQVVNKNGQAARALVQTGEYDALQEYVDGMDSDWNAKHDLGYFGSMLAVCSEVTAFGSPSDKRKSFLLTLIERALAKDSSNGMRRCELFVRQADFLRVLMKEDVFDGDLNYRERRCQALAGFLARINTARDPLYVPVLETANIAPVMIDGIKPGDIPLGGVGGNLDLIKNEVLRKEYEKRIRENRERSETNQTKIASNRIYSLFESDIKKFFVAAYKNDAKGLKGLQHWLDIGKFSKSFADDVLARLAPSGADADAGK